MSCFTVVLDPTVEAFYRRIAAQAGLTLETVRRACAGGNQPQARTIAKKAPDFSRKPAKAPLFFAANFAILYPKHIPSKPYERISGTCHEITSGLI